MVAQNGKMVVLISPMDNQAQLENSTETSPLNQRLRDNNSDISSSPSSAVTITTSEQSTKQLIQSDSSRQSTKLLLKIIIDIGILGFVGSCVLIFMLIGEPHKRGFFCNDESLLHPYHKSTVKHWMLFLFGGVLPIFIIFLTETIRSKMNLDDEHHEQEMKLFKWTITTRLQHVYKFIGVFLIGTASCQLITDIGKYSLGRYRPHFLTLCRPILIDGSDCTDPKNIYQYIEEFTCSNPNITEKLLKDMRMSFPSANSSFSFFTMTFCALYLNARFEWKGSKMLNYFLQFILIAIAWFTSLSRISDYKHHWSDVLAGALLGFLFAIFVCHYILKLRKREKCSILKLPSTKYELCSQSAASQQAQNGV